MSGSVVRFGRYVTGPEIDRAEISGGQQLGYTANKAPGSNLIVYRLGAWIGPNGTGSTAVRLALHNTSNLNPTSILASSSAVTATANYVDISGGQSVLANLSAPVVVGPYNYGLSAAVTRDASISMRAAAAISGDNKNFYRRSAPSGVPQSLSGISGSYEGHESIWAEGEYNVAPSAPSNISVSNSLKPVIAATFNDANKVLNNGVAWDQVSGAQILVKQGSTTLWNYSYDTSPSEKNGHRTSRTYGGSALLYNTTYTVQVRHRDRLGVWGAWSSPVSFSISNPNHNPNTPTGLSPASSAAGTNLRPTFTSNFSDPDEVLPTGQAWDYLDAYQIRVQRVSDGTWMWNNTYTASSGERSARKTSIQYPASGAVALDYNTTYQYSIRHRDRGGLWSGWAYANFSITSLSTVDEPTAPDGKITTLAPTISAVYRHQSGLSSNAVQARLLSETGSVVATGSVVSKTVAANGTISLTWAQSGLPALSWGTGYQMQVRARDTNGEWSPNWSPAHAFRTNAAPLVPVRKSPLPGAVTGSRPEIRVTASDPDGDAITVYIEILNASDSVIATRTATKASGNEYRYQTTASDLASFGTYGYRAYSYDGSLYSGESTTAAGAARSPKASFNYANVPNITITGPSSPVNGSFDLTWTTDDQTSWVVRLQDPDTGNDVYIDSLVSSSVKTKHIDPAGSSYWQGGYRWHTGETLNAVVEVKGSLGAWGTSDPFPILLEYDPEPALALDAYQESLPGTVGPNAIRLQGEMSAADASAFDHYTYHRTELERDGSTVRPGTRILLRSTRNPSETELLDADVTSGQWYRYEYTQYVNRGNDVIPSTPTTKDQMVRWDGTVLHCPFDPEGYVIELRAGKLGRSYEPEVKLDQPSKSYSRVGRGSRVAFFGKGQTADPSGDYALYGDSVHDIEDQVEAIARIWSAQGGEVDGRPHIVCWREGRGGPFGRIYGRILKPTIGWDKAGLYSVSIDIEELDHTLGEEDEA